MKLVLLSVCLAAPPRGGGYFLCCCKESNQRKQPVRPKHAGVATRDTRGMEQPLSVRLCAERFLARPWLPRRAFLVFGAAAFRSGLALRARTKGRSGASACAAVDQALMNGSVAMQEDFATLRLRLCLASARSARRMNDAAPTRPALRDGSQGSARKGSAVRATLRG